VLFDLEDVTYSRGGKVVLRGVRARLPVGASSLLGPSGSGKSTMLRLLNRLADPDSDFEDRDASKLSVGEQQRVMLARALALEPRVLLLDEPTSALDQAAREAVEGTLKRLRARTAISLVVVTHDIAQARRLADYVVRIDSGGVIAQGPAAELLEQPEPELATAEDAT
jgi:ABC-type cobalamin/Fe3+-siderophores transport system ATPase subunit